MAGDEGAVTPQAEPVETASGIDGPLAGTCAAMTAMPPDPTEDDQYGDDYEDQDAEPTSTAPEENNPTAPDPPD
jgi:hypothetical protein